MSFDVMSFLVVLCHVMQCDVMWCPLLWWTAICCEVTPCNGMGSYEFVMRCGWLRCHVVWFEVVVRCGELEDDLVIRTTKYYSILQSTTPYYTVVQSTTPYYKVLLRTTKYYSVLQSNNPFDSPNTWNAQYNARRSHPRTSPNIAPGTKNDSHDWSSSQMKRHLLWSHEKWLSWLILVTNETSFTSRGATDFTHQRHQTVCLPRKITFQIRKEIGWNGWSVIYNGGRSDHDPRMIRPWSEHDCKHEIARLNPYARRAYFSLLGNALNYNISRSGYLPKFHQILRLPRKMSLQQYQTLHLPRKVRCEWWDWCEWCVDRCEWWVSYSPLSYSTLPWATELLWATEPIWTTELLYWTVTWLNCSLTELLLAWTVPWLNCHLSELFLDWTVPWLNWSLTELLLDCTVPWLNCSLTELFLDWTVPWLNCSLTELFLDWTVPWLNCSLTELLLDWNVTWLNCYLTELLLDCTVPWLNCYLT